ncbi:3-methyl-2-oxobutanoate hydroxymethyltransferase [Algibacter marinivivus]|uniref:3-methyl-2-oxobutanoate hydroxymethyltransferase n=1 Tax=Algibacter marinivivus TaxID=2100723 RepID=A0A2U2X460_9FLAO|nr:nuclear transport factor 2 family protein [Algibacter marinivivus]PWH82567.1 3-methyl-2-oxobutanoate hydroxymethyltransferase [Algibacter marinivivus]
MARIIFYLALLISTTLFGQIDEEAQVKATVDTFFEGFHKGDTALMKSVMVDKILMQTAYRNKEGKDILVTDDPNKLINAIADRPDDQKWDERLLDYSIQVDGNMANAWTPYEFWFNDTFSHCGVNSFQMFKDGNQWKIIYLIDTRRRSTCNQ